MPATKKIAWIIRSCRESRGYSQDYMAEMLDVCQSTYANIESGKTSLSIDRLCRITDILGLDIHEVIDTGIVCDEEGLAQKNALVFPATKEVYDQLIAELRNEVDFLKEMIRSQQSHSAPVTHTPQRHDHAEW